MPELGQERLDYLLKIMCQNSIEYFVTENSYEIRLIPELQQAYKQIEALIGLKITTSQIEKCVIALDDEVDVGLMKMDKMKGVLTHWLKEQGLEIEK